MTPTPRKKLIEVALPLDAINKACAREKSIRHGHPSTLHLWWARRPLAAARAVLFSQIVDDPSSDPAFGNLDGSVDEERASLQRSKLFNLLEELVLWENTTNEPVLHQARTEIARAIAYTLLDTGEMTKNQILQLDGPGANALAPKVKLPPFTLWDLITRQANSPQILAFLETHAPGFHDPFAGGGALPLEAQRLGLKSYASDLNPVAVLINKAMIEIPPKFAGLPPVNPDSRGEKSLIGRQWKGAQGLASDVRYYGQWMRDEAQKRIGHLYPKVKITKEMVKERPDLKQYEREELTVIAWLWARTVKSPNPAFSQVDVPLASTFMLSTKAGKEAYVQPVIEGGGYRFTVKVGKSKDAEAAKRGTKLVRANFVCLMSGTPIPGDYIKAEGKAGRIGARLMAIVAEGNNRRIYLTPTREHEAAALKANPEWKPELMISGSTQYLGVKPYGMDRFDQIFTDRQLVALVTFSDLVQELRERVKKDFLATPLPDDAKPLRDGGSGATAYADAMGVYISFAINKLADRGSTSCAWDPSRDGTGHTFGRQAIPMVWDFAEINVFSSSSGCWNNHIGWVVKVLAANSNPGHGVAIVADAQTQSVSANKVISTDPPYYDNVPYADLSDFFYVWLRRTLKPVFPDLFATISVPKTEELVAFAYRHDGKAGAEAFFLDGMTKAMHRLADQAHPAFPVTIYYAFKQSESDPDEGTASTGWETFLHALFRAGFATSGTWPMRTELANRMRGMDSNALASSIVLVCRKRVATAPTATLKDFLTLLRRELPPALAHLQTSNIAPVDMAQAAIGPGMALFTRFARIIEPDGTALSVRKALALINQILDEVQSEQEGDFDPDTRFAIQWFSQYGHTIQPFGVADTLSRAKGTSVDGLTRAGILEAKAGKVRLIPREELDPDWDPETDPRLTIWEATQHLIRRLEGQGEEAASALQKQLDRKGSYAETARELAYRLYTLCERNKWADLARSYNGLVASWNDMSRIVSGATPVKQKSFDIPEDEE